MDAAQAHFLQDALINLSHELRTPLAAIKGYTTSLVRHDQRLTRAERIAMLGEIDSACDRLDEVIEQTTQTARVLQGQISLQRQEADLGTLTRQALVTLERGHDDTSSPHTITFSSDEPLLIVADERLLVQALVHLLDNARTYSPDGGDIAITARRTAAEGRMLAEWSVTDQGIGIAPEHVPQVFTPFYRVENHLARTANGLGLGLAFTQRVIALHGGELQVASVPGEGSRFWFTLPLAGE
jgi:signal transduction histidine kinase